MRRFATSFSTLLSALSVSLFLLAFLASARTFKPDESDGPGCHGCGNDCTIGANFSRCQDSHGYLPPSCTCLNDPDGNCQCYLQPEDANHEFPFCWCTTL